MSSSPPSVVAVAGPRRGLLGRSIHFTDYMLTAAMAESQTSILNGSKKANRFNSSSVGFFISKLILKSIKGLLKSTFNSLEAVMVIAPMATWAL